MAKNTKKVTITTYGIFENGKLIEEVSVRSDLNYGTRDLAMDRLLAYNKLPSNKTYSLSLLYKTV